MKIKNPVAFNTGRNIEDEYVTYTIVTCQASATAPADVAKMKIKRFRGGSRRTGSHGA